MIYKIYNESSSSYEMGLGLIEAADEFMAEYYTMANSIYESVMDYVLTESTEDEDPEAWLYESYDIFNEGVVDFVKGIVKKITTAISNAINFIKTKIFGKKVEQAANEIKNSRVDEEGKLTLITVNFKAVKDAVDETFNKNPGDIKDDDTEKAWRDKFIKGFNSGGEFLTEVTIDKSSAKMYSALKSAMNQSKSLTDGLKAMIPKVEKELPGKLEKAAKESGEATEDSDENKKSDKETKKQNASTVTRYVNLLNWVIHFSSSRAAVLTENMTNKWYASIDSKKAKDYDAYTAKKRSEEYQKMSQKAAAEEKKK